METYTRRDIKTGAVKNYEVSTKVKMGRSLEVPAVEGTMTERVPSERMLINGTDNRYHVKNTKQAPFSYIAYIVITWPSGKKSSATAWMMGRSTAVTNAHCVYSAKQGGFATSIQLYPGKNKLSTPFGSANVTMMNYWSSWLEKGGAARDFSIIELDRNIGDKTGWFGYQYSSGSYVGTQVTLGGYPVGGRSDDLKSAELWKKTGKISYNTSGELRYKIDATSGQSGSPIYLSSHRVIGLHSRGYENSNINAGKRIDEEMYNWLQKFP